MQTNNKLREALSSILGIADHLQIRFEMPKLVNQEILELKQIAEAALAEPVKNCEVGTAEELFSRHDKYCNNQPDCKLCNSPMAVNNCIRCFAKWAQLPYESEAAK